MLVKTNHGIWLPVPWLVMTALMESACVGSGTTIRQMELPSSDGVHLEGRLLLPSGADNNAILLVEIRNCGDQFYSFVAPDRVGTVAYNLWTGDGRPIGGGHCVAATSAKTRLIRLHPTESWARLYSIEIEDLLPLDRSSRLELRVRVGPSETLVVKRKLDEDKPIVCRSVLLAPTNF